MKQFALLMLALGQVICLRAGDPSDEPVGRMRTNLYIAEPGKKAVLMDGTLTQYHSTFSSDIDGRDARKMSNFSENWGMLRGTTTYVVEARKSIGASDTIFFKMWNMRVIRYEIEFDPVNLEREGRIAILEDRFLKTSSPVDLTQKSRIAFEVTSDPESKAANRFQLVYYTQRLSALLPVTFVKADAELRGSAVAIQWQTANESELVRYDVEKSTDGVNFRSAGSIRAENKAENHYSWNDYDGENASYYRIKSVGKDEQISYSEVLRIKRTALSAGTISVFPNPVTTPYVQLKIEGKQSGNYDVSMMNALGNTILTKTVAYRGGNQLERIQLPAATPAGIYRIEVKGNGKKEVISVVIAR